MIETLTRQMIVDAAREEMGTPFHHQGRLTRIGIDCIGLLILTGRKVGHEPKDSIRYGKIPRPGRLHAGMAESGLIRIQIEDAGHGDVLTFQFDRRGEVHVSILAKDQGRDTMIHTFNMGATFVGGPPITGKVVEHGIDEYWLEKIVSAWRYPGIDD